MLFSQEYVLAHLEPPDSLEAAEAGIRKFEDFLLSMENNQDKILGPVHSGNSLVEQGNLYSAKIKEKVQQIEDRYHRGPGGVRAGELDTDPKPSLPVTLALFPQSIQAQEEQRESSGRLSSAKKQLGAAELPSELQRGRTQAGGRGLPCRRGQKPLGETSSFER